MKATIPGRQPRKTWQWHGPHGDSTFRNWHIGAFEAKTQCKNCLEIFSMYVTFNVNKSSFKQFKKINIESHVLTVGKSLPNVKYDVWRSVGLSMGGNITFISTYCPLSCWIYSGKNENIFHFLSLLITLILPSGVSCGVCSEYSQVLL